MSRRFVGRRDDAVWKVPGLVCERAIGLQSGESGCFGLLRLSFGHPEYLVRTVRSQSDTRLTRIYSDRIIRSYSPRPGSSTADQCLEAHKS